jgi:hypothetical protein
MNTAAIAAVLAVLLAIPGAYLAIRELRRREDVALFIPSPDPDQDPLRPDFWVFPPRECDGGDAVVIAGRMVNAGPDPARSVRVYADPEIDPADARGPLEAAFEVVVASHPGEKREELWREFSKHYRGRNDYVSLLQAGDDLRFVVVARYARPNLYIERIRAEGEPTERSRDWVEDGRQAHAVHAAMRRKNGAGVEFGPSELCAPGGKA